MTHYLVTVVLPEKATVEMSRSEMEASVTRLISKYDEQLYVAEYDTDCICVLMSRSAYAQARAIEVSGMDINEFRTEFQGSLREYLKGRMSPEQEERFEKIQDLKQRMEQYAIDKIGDDPFPEYIHLAIGFDNEVVQPVWVDVIKPHTDAYYLAEKEFDTLYKQSASSPDCEYCNDTGLRKTTYNPDSKYDYWSIQFIDPIFESKEATYALVTPDGVWHARGKMGWWAMSDDKMTAQEWNDLFAEIIKPLHDHHIVVLDCHI